MKTQTFLRSLGLLALLLFLAAACRPGYDLDPSEPVTDTFAAANFDRLDVSSALLVNVRRGNSFRVVAHGDRRDLNELRVEQSGGTLFVGYRTSRANRYPIDVEITLPYLRSVRFTGAVTGEVLGFTNADELDLDLSGASKLTFGGTADLLYADLAGASELFLEGSAYELSVGLTGASYLDAFDFPVQEAIVEASGASRALVRASRTLAVRATGASSVRFRGNPAVTTQLSGGSTVLRD